MKTLTIRNIPDDVYAAFKATCAREQVTMHEKVKEFVTREAENILLLGVHHGGKKTEYSKRKAAERAGLK